MVVTTLSRPTTVMYLIDTYISPPDSDLKGGTEKQLCHLASTLNPKYFKSVVVQLSTEKSIPMENGRFGAAEIRHLPTGRFYSLKGLQQLRRLCSMAKQRKVDILHTFFEKSEVMGWLAFQLSGVPFWVTSRRDLGFKRKEIYQRIFKFTSKSCTKCIANCVAVKERVICQEQLPEDKVEVIYNGLDFSAYQTVNHDGVLKKELGIGRESYLVGLIANFNFEIKGHQYFLEAAQKTLEKIPDVRFLLVGDGPLRLKYETLAKELGVKERVYFLGKRNDVPKIISSLDISVLSSTSEGLSNVILESMAAGKPVVVTNVGGSSEIVKDGITGYLVPPGNSKVMADAIISLLKDPDKARAIGATGKKIVQENFTVEAMVKRYESLYLSLMEGRNRRFGP